jgi:hypothetical protein
MSYIPRKGISPLNCSFTGTAYASAITNEKDNAVNNAGNNKSFFMKLSLYKPISSIKI